MKFLNHNRRMLTIAGKLAFLSTKLTHTGCETSDESEAPSEAEADSEGEASDSEGAEGPNASRLEDMPIWHPAMDFARLGLPPDIMTNPAPDHRWGIEEGIEVKEDGTTHWSGGAIRLERRTLGPDEHQVMVQRKLGAHELVASGAIAPADKISEPLHVQAEAMADDDWVDITVIHERPLRPTLLEELIPAIATGAIRTRGEFEESRQILIAERELELEDTKDTLSELVEDLGGEVTGFCNGLECVTALVPRELLMELAEHPDIAGLEEVGTVVLPESDGIAVVRGSQLSQYLDQPYVSLNSEFDGERRRPSTADDLYMAIVEQHDFHDNHPGFRDESNGAFRFGSKFNCVTMNSTATCTSISDFPTLQTQSGAQHATFVAGVAMGDLVDGQDGAVTDPTTRRRRSGIAREARAHLLKFDGSGASAIAALNKIAAMVPAPPIVLFSQGLSSTIDIKCLGRDGLSRAANALYEVGALLIKSAGNRGHASATDCMVSAPGSGIGVFTVGAHSKPQANDLPQTGTETDVRGAGIWLTTSLDPAFQGSARGGNPLSVTAEGRGRSIVDLTAYGAWTQGYGSRMPSGFPPTDYVYDLRADGTSYSAPVVAGAAINFIDYFKDFAASFGQDDVFISSPGVLFANLLLMGDRKGQTGNCSGQVGQGDRLCSGFDNLWGAGRLKMRRADSQWLSAPGQWRTGTTCVSNWESASIPIDGGQPLPGTVDDFKAVVYWYDPLHPSGYITDIDLYLSVTDSALTTFVISDYIGENKERVYHSAVGGKTVELGIYGIRIDKPDRGCGLYGMQVHWAYFWENDARSGVMQGTIDPE